MRPIIITPAMLERTKKDLQNIAGEPLDVEEQDGWIYAFGSELATLRLYKKYNSHSRNEKTSADFSKPLNRFYFLIKVNP